MSSKEENEPLKKMGLSDNHNCGGKEIEDFFMEVSSLDGSIWARLFEGFITVFFIQIVWGFFTTRYLSKWESFRLSFSETYFYFLKKGSKTFPYMNEIITVLSFIVCRFLAFFIALSLMELVSFNTSLLSLHEWKVLYLFHTHTHTKWHMGENLKFAAFPRKIKAINRNFEWCISWWKIGNQNYVLEDHFKDSVLINPKQYFSKFQGWKLFKGSWIQRKNGTKMVSRRV